MRGTLLAAAMFVLAVAPAYGSDLRIAETVNRDGDPGLTAGLTRWDGSTVEWRRCAHAGAVCKPLPASAYLAGVRDRGGVAFPGTTPAGTVFQAVATRAGVVTKARTRRWKGRATSTRAPVLQGDAVVGRPVTAAEGTWTGGWASRRGVSIRRSIYAC